MKVYGPQDIRNVVLLGHGGTGKTTLTSAMLYSCKGVTRFGKVEDGTAPTDFEEDEIQRKLSISTSVAFAEWNKAKINILDTPGYGNFIADARGPVRVADTALVLVNGVSGVEVMTAKGFEYAEEFQVPRLLLINKMDRENASFARTLASITENFGRLAVPVFLPLGQEKDFAGIVDLVKGKAHRYKDDSGAYTEEDIPADMAEEASKARAALVEMVAELDEKLMEKYFEAGDLTAEDLASALRLGIAQDKIFPVLCASAHKNIGVADVMNFLVEFTPPASAKTGFLATPRGGGDEVDVAADAGAPASAFVFKTVSDPAQGRISVFRVISGKIPTDATLTNVNRDVPERMAGLFYLRGKEHVKAEEAQAGDIAAVMKLKETHTGESLCAKEHLLVFQPVKYPIPAISFAVEPKSRGDEEKIMSALQRMIDEDPNLKVGRDPQTHETLVSGSGSQHVEVVAARVQRRYGVEMDIKQPKVPYKETIKGRAEVHARHKKQTGGHGQFADIQIRMEPLPRGRRLRVQGRDLRRRRAPQLHPRGGEGHARIPRARRPGGLPRRGRADHPLRRRVPPRGLLRNGLQDRRPHGVQGGHGQVQAHPPRAGHDRRGGGARGEHGRRHGRPEQPPRAHPGHGPEGRQPGHQGPGAPERDADLRLHPQVHHGGPRLLQHGVHELRGRPCPDPAEDRRGGQEGQGRGEGIEKLSAISCQRTAFSGR